jgi:dipeptidyl aminopeptidase/acylaminoacyl peptidase
LSSASAHWRPRFTANGVTPSDFEKITAPLTSWDQWCAAWSRAAAGHEALGRSALDLGRTLSAGAHLARAAVYYHFAKFLFVQHPGEAKVAHGHAVRCLTDALPHLEPPGERHEIPFQTGALVGVLRRPRAPGPHAVVVLIPGLDSAKEEFGATEALFLDRGLATFSVDGPGQGEAEYDLAIRGDWEIPGAAILDYVGALDGVDPDRIGLWGVSLGGYYAPRVASDQKVVKACIALAGPYNFGVLWDELPQLTREAFRARSFSATDEEARAKALELTLENRAERITVPLQVVMGKLDRLVPWEHARRLAQEASGPVEFLLLEDGNHGCANVVHQHRHRSADWMAEQLGAR